jgi:hypothetical protein
VTTDNDRILADVRRVLDAYQGDRITTRLLAGLRNDLPGRAFDADLNAQALSKRLGRLGVRPEPVPWREGGRTSKSVRGYRIRFGARYTRQWADAFQRSKNDEEDR